jgi:D-alanyl-D-alanine carboxypeptidase (penicillin-binding protein 5/6)
MKLQLFALTFALATLLGTLTATADTPPPLAATAYILIDATTGTVLAENNADQQVPPASLTKMMTDYIVAQELKRGTIHADDKVHISEHAWSMQGSKMFVTLNSDVKIMDLIRGMIIQSGNDATVALAEHIAGSEDAFAERMNKTAAELGMKHTSYRNASGWPDPDHYTTARDLALLGQAMVNNTPEQYKISAEKEFVWEADGHAIKQPNRNLLLWRDPSVDGIKTGHTDEAGYCLVASAKRGDTRLISVVMGTKTTEARATESEKLLTYGFHAFQTQKIFPANKVFQQVPVWEGVAKQVDVGVKQAVVLTIPWGTQDKVQTEVTVNKNIEAPILEGDALGTLVVKLNGKEILNQPVVAMSTVPQGGFVTRSWDRLHLLMLHLFGGAQ